MGAALCVVAAGAHDARRLSPDEGRSVRNGRLRLLGGGRARIRPGGPSRSSGEGEGDGECEARPKELVALASLVGSAAGRTTHLCVSEGSEAHIDRVLMPVPAWVVGTVDVGCVVAEFPEAWRSGGSDHPFLLPVPPDGHPMAGSSA